MSLKIAGNLILTILAVFMTACGDSGFLDKTAQHSSILRGEKMSELSPVKGRTVLLVQDLEFDSDRIPTLFGICSGLILDSRTVLTAAHCLENKTRGMKVILKSDPRSGLNKIEDVYTVIDSRLHPNYVSATLNASKTLEEIKNNTDLALIYTDRNLPLNANEAENLSVATADLIQSIRRDQTVDMLITGYGRTTNLQNTKNHSFSQVNGILNQATVPMTTNNLHRMHFSLNQKETAGVCSGDSGGPVFIKHNDRFHAVALAIGVYATDPADICSGFGLYINLDFYRAWMTEAARDLKIANI